MALTIPDYANASFIEQAAPDSVDFDAIVAGFGFTGIDTGLAVTQRAAGANLSVDVAAGGAFVAGTLSTLGSTSNNAITADATNPRWALISFGSGTVTVTLGTAAATPVFPAIPAGKALLAAVWVPAAAASILNANIVDKRVILASNPATSVVSQTSFGAAATVGSGLNFALEGHAHGTPATPVTSAVAGTGIGVSGATGAVTISNTGALSVAGRSGAVSLTAADIAAGTFPGANSFTGLQTLNAGLTVSAGNVGLGTTSPQAPFHFHDGTVSENFYITSPATGTNYPGLRIGFWNGVGFSNTCSIDVARNNGDAGFSDATVGDLALKASGAVRLGGPTSSSMLRISQADVAINDNATARSLVRGPVGYAYLTANSAQNITANTITPITGTVSVNGAAGSAGTLQVAVPMVNGRKYRARLFSIPFGSVATTAGVNINVSGGTGTGFGASTGAPTGWTLTGGTVNDNCNVAGSGYALIAESIFTATSTASVTVIAQAKNTGAVGNLNFGIGTYILIEDIGT